MRLSRATCHIAHTRAQIPYITTSQLLVETITSYLAIGVAVKTGSGIIMLSFTAPLNSAKSVSIYNDIYKILERASPSPQPRIFGRGDRSPLPPLSLRQWPHWAEYTVKPLYAISFYHHVIRMSCKRQQTCLPAKHLHILLAEPEADGYRTLLIYKFRLFVYFLVTRHNART